MKRKMKSIWMLLLILVSLYAMLCQGCWKHERKALLHLNAHFDIPSDWIDGTDCCQWKRVVCNSTTGRVAELDLSYLRDYWLGHWHLNYSDFQVFKDLKSLYLSMNYIDGCVENTGLENLEVLHLRFNSLNNTASILSCLNGLSSLKNLDLHGNMLNATSSVEAFETLSSKLLKLEVLDLGYNNLTNDFLPSLEKYTSLNELYLAYTGLDSDLHFRDGICLLKLEELDLSDNGFVGPLPTSFANMTSLRTLDLSNNHFTGEIASKLARLTSLEYLYFGYNQFEVPISFTPFANHSNLKFIYGDGNKVIMDSQPTSQNWVRKFQLQGLSLSSTIETGSLPLPNFLLYQYNLSYLYFERIRLEVQLPTWLLENNTRMESFVLTNCSITGAFHLPSRPHPSLQYFDISNNEIIGPIQSYNFSSIFPKLETLDMSRNSIEGSLPSEFGQMISVDTLDLSDNQLSGEISLNITRVRLTSLRLSNNKLVGPLFFPTSSTLRYLYLDSNNFSGSIPNSLFNTSLSYIDISNNNLVGMLPSKASNNASNLMALSLSNNHIEGSIPAIFGELKWLSYLDISRNKLTGSLPSFVNSSLSIIHLRNNRLSGLGKQMFRGSSSLVGLDISYNNLTSRLDDMIYGLHHTRLSFLLLKGNHFMGHIPRQFCQLTYLTFLDLSENNFSGPIPNCLGKLPFEMENSTDIEEILYGYYIFQVFFSGIAFSSLPVFKNDEEDFITKKISYPYSGYILRKMTGINLSSNKLNGNIPLELGNLKNIRALNLSHNCLTGKIPATFSNLIQIESLDLSFNKLSGNIPPQLSRLTFLAVFSVAHNNLSGTTPDRKDQFGTFDESSYEDNPLLCGPPLQSCTTDGQPHALLPNSSYDDGDNNDSVVDMFIFTVSFAISYTSVLLVIVATICINPYWRQAWFYYIEFIITNCYYFIEDNLCKFPNIRK